MKMNTDKFIERVLDGVDPNAQQSLSGLSKNDRALVAHAVQEEATAEFDRLAKDADYDDFKISNDAKKRVEDRIQKQIFNDDLSKVKSAKMYASNLIKDYQWTIKNSRLLRRLRDSIEEFKASIAPPPAN